MIVLDNIEFIELGVIVLAIGTVAWRNRGQRRYEQPSNEVTSSITDHHNPHIYIVQRDGSSYKRIQELTNGHTASADNHQAMKDALASGPDIGIEWNNGRIEWGVDK